MSDQLQSRKADAARASFKNREFRRVWFTVAMANSAMYGIILTAGLYAYQLSHSSVIASASYTVMLLPSVIVGPLAGSFVDRNDRRKVLRIGMLVAIVPMALLVVSDAAGTTTAYVIMGFCAIIGGGRSLYGAAWQALVPELLPPEDLVAGGSLMRVATQGGEALGPLIIGVVIKLSGTASGFIGCLVLYGLAMLMTRGMKSVYARHQMPKRAGMLDGVRRIMTTKPLGSWMVFVAFHCCLTMAFMGLLPAYATHVLNAANFDSVMMTVIGVGAICGAGALAVAPRSTHTGRIAIGSGLLSGLSIALLGVTTSAPLAILACFLAGGSQAMFMSLIYAMVQGNAPYDLRGRVAGYQNTLTSGSMALLSSAWGALQHPFGYFVTLVVPGLAFALVVVYFVGRLDLWRDRNGVHEITPSNVAPSTA